MNNEEEENVKDVLEKLVKNQENHVENLEDIDAKQIYLIL
jgi:hypothetical protein